MDAALTIAARSCAESTLNEHGMGLKHALASINAGEDQHWSIQTRTAEDVANAFHAGGKGAIINSSRGIMCAWKKTGQNGLDYQEAARQAALAMREDICAYTTIGD